MIYPKHAYKSARAFKTKKRADLKNVLTALSELRIGCAYTPAYKEILKASDMFEDEIKSLLSIKHWGR